MNVETRSLKSGISLYTVSAAKLKFSVMNFGCTIVNLFVPDKNGKDIDILLGFDDLESFRNGKDSHNAIVGRVANRISGASFVLDGKKYKLDKNEGENCLHGGFLRFEKLLWNGEPFCTENSVGVKFFLNIASGFQGFPGNLDIEILYYATSDDELFFEYKAACDRRTPINITNHSYFNLDGGGSVLSHALCLDCDEILEIADDMIPTGRKIKVFETPFDFKIPKLIGEDIEKIPSPPGGYDHCFVTKANEKELVKIGSLYGAKSGIVMDVESNQRGVQVYTANFLEGVKGKKGIIHGKHDGICLETQRFPDSINVPAFPKDILSPGEIYHSITKLKFGIREI